MDLEQLRERIGASMHFLAPQLGDTSQLINECLDDAARTFDEAFICQLSPSVWAKITLIYYKHFLDTGCDVSVAEIVAAVVSDSVATKRMDWLTLNLAQQKRELREQKQASPVLTVVKP